MIRQGADDPSWAVSLATLVGRRVKELRSSRGISAQVLADRTAAIGYEVKRSVIAEMENGKRSTIPLADVLVLARALSVPPVLLIVPIGSEQTVELLPEFELSPWDAFDWLTGEGEIMQVPRWATLEQDQRERAVWRESVKLIRLKQEYERNERNQRAHELWADVYSGQIDSGGSAEQVAALRRKLDVQMELIAQCAQAATGMVQEFAELGVEWPPSDSVVSHRNPRVGGEGA